MALRVNLAQMVLALATKALKHKSNCSVCAHH